MISFAISLTLASYATAQVLSLVPNPNLSASSTASSSSTTGAPPAPTMSPSGSGYSGSSMSPAYNQYTTTAAPAQYTAPPQSAAMPYESFMSGGYKSMSCGYGYNKGSDGSCTSTESWVRIPNLEISSAAIYAAQSYVVVYHGLLSDAVVPVSTTLQWVVGQSLIRAFLQMLSAAPDDCHPNHDGDTHGHHDRHQDHDGDDDLRAFFFHGMRSKFELCAAQMVTVPTTVTQTMTDFKTMTDMETMTEIMTSTMLVPTTRVYVSTEVVDETATVEHTLTATDTMTQFNTFFKTNTETQTATEVMTSVSTQTDYVTKTYLSTIVQPTTYLSTVVSTQVIDNVRLSFVAILRIFADLSTPAIDKDH